MRHESRPLVHSRFRMSVIVTVLLLAATVLAQNIPHPIHFIGTVREPHGSEAFLTFALYAEENGGAALWSETQRVAVDLGGRYEVVLGESVPLPASIFAAFEAHWLGVSDGGGAERARVLLIPLPYSGKAGDADTLSGDPAAESLTLDEGSGNHRPARPTQRSGTAVPVTTGTALAVQSSGLSGVSRPTRVDISGPAAPGPRFTMLMDINNNGVLDAFNDLTSTPLAMVLNPSGGKVGIGTATPGQKLSVAGTIESTTGGFKFPDGSVQQTAAGGGGGSSILSGTIVMTIGVSIAAGACHRFTGTVTGATTGMTAVASPAGDPATNGLPDITMWDAFVTGPGAVTLKICAFAHDTASVSSPVTFNIRVIP